LGHSRFLGETFSFSTGLFALLSPITQVVKNVSEDSVILLGEDNKVWSMTAVENAEHMARSR